MKRLVETHKELFGEQPKEVHSPLDKDDKPELDESPLLGPDGIKRYQTLIGAAQWLITLSRFDIQRGDDDDDDIQDWNAKVLNHVLVEILDKERVDAHASDAFTVFVITNGYCDVCFLMIMTEGDLHAMGHLINFKTHSLLQALNKILFP